jgi:hypothetical protein
VVKQSIPLSMTMKERIDLLRLWAATRARPASSAEPEPTEDEDLLVMSDAAQAIQAAIEETHATLAQQVP